MYLLKSQEIRLVPYLSSTNLSNMVFYNYDLWYDINRYIVYAFGSFQSEVWNVYI